MTQTKKLISPADIPWYWWAFTALVCFNFWQIYHHDMWRDEIQAWLIASESGWSLSELWKNMKFEPHPGLWHFILWLLSRLSKDPFVMQLFHFFCGTAAALLVLLYVPFAAWIRMLIVMGYYLSFEYLLISRNYVIGVFLIFLFCSIYDKIKRKPATGGAVLGLLANTSVFGSLLSLTLYGCLLSDIFSDPEKSSGAAAKKRRYVIISSIIFFILFFINIGFMTLSESKYGQEWHFDFHLLRFIYFVLVQILAMAPVPDFTVNFWNTLYLDSIHNMPIIILFSAVITAGTIITLHRTRIGLYAFYFVFTVMVFLQYGQYNAPLRYSGHLFVLLLALVWLGHEHWKPKSREIYSKSLSTSFFVLLLVLNVFAAVVAGYYHGTNKFSGAKDMAALMHSNNYTSRPIIAYPDWSATPVSGYARTKFYDMMTGNQQSFVLWKDDRAEVSLKQALLNVASDIISKTGKRPLILLNYSLEDWNQLLVGKVEGAIVSDENYYLYSCPY